MRLGAIAAVLIAVLAMWAPACGLEPSGSASPDASTGDSAPDVPADQSGDVPGDVPTGDGSDCLVLSCNGVCVDSCAGCAAGESLCPETRACGNCSGCTGRTIECFNCSGERFGTCVPSPAACNPGTPCPCTDNVANCPGGPTQVCTSSGCLPCGANGTDDKPCKDGRQCEDDADASCR